MNYLLDTHTCIWAIGKQSKLSATVKEILQNAANNFWVSKISLLEIAIKKKIGKLEEFEISIPEFIGSIYSSGYYMLQLNDEHFQSYDNIDFHETHRDPFDRYLLAAAQFEKFAIISKDEKFKLYTDTFEIVW
ncbi:MAG: type II toxin-antitoxin system VapC family toxin [Chitinophagaceae bacterium]|nr:type II toxin-antitoxin system VapC family toxin [Chitinophagaceae bacterium]